MSKKNKYGGRVTKDKGGYLDTLRDATSESEDLYHPRHYNITMQIHHIISEKGVRDSELGADLERYGYDINQRLNLIHLPSTLQGACHLGVQAHIGNHNMKSETDTELDDDNKRDDSYHDIVKERIKKVERHMGDHCPAEHPENRKKVTDEMNAISRKLAKKMQDAPATLRLTSYAEHFTKAKGKFGCGGLSKIVGKKPPKQPCPVGRNHYQQQGPNQKNEDITYDFSKPEFKPYELKAGR